MGLTGAPIAVGEGALDDEIARVCRAVADAATVVPVGSRTQWEVGGPAPSGTEVRAPGGVVEYDPAELTVTVGAGMQVRELDALLAGAGQQCPLDPRDPAATIGGVLATGLSGLRRLRYGPLRNRLLEVHFVTGAGVRIKGGGRTVKNVSGYDVARLLVGSFGTLGVLVQVTLRCEPLASSATWLATEGSGTDAVARAFRPAAVLVASKVTTVLVEGDAADITAEGERLGAVSQAARPSLPEGSHRGRISVGPPEVDAVVRALAGEGLDVLGEAGVGTVHVAAASADGIARARAVAIAHGGWLLREEGSADDDGFGCELPNRALMERVKDALDPAWKCNPGRLPLRAPSGDLR